VSSPGPPAPSRAAYGSTGPGAWDDPTEYVLVEAFRDGDAGAAHVQSQHFKDAQQSLPPHLAETPRIINFTIDQDDWSELGEMAVHR
jgi:quinol monooxygenase YgiN